MSVIAGRALKNGTAGDCSHRVEYERNTLMTSNKKKTIVRT